MLFELFDHVILDQLEILRLSQADHVEGIRSLAILQLKSVRLHKPQDATVHVTLQQKQKDGIWIVVKRHVAHSSLHRLEVVFQHLARDALVSSFLSLVLKLVAHQVVLLLY